MTMPNMFTVALERKEREREVGEKPDMVEAIADKLLEDHMSLMEECEALRQQLAECQRDLSAMMDIRTEREIKLAECERERDAQKVGWFHKEQVAQYRAVLEKFVRAMHDDSYTGDLLDEALNDAESLLEKAK